MEGSNLFHTSPLKEAKRIQGKDIGENVRISGVLPFENDEREQLHSSE